MAPGARALGSSAELLGQSLVEPFADSRWKRRRLGLAVDLDGLARGIHHQMAVLAVLQVPGERLGQCRVELAVQVFAKPSNEFSTGQRPTLS
jgi:hypothetical protein